MKRFSEEHEWVDLQDDVAVVGISTFAAKELGDITFVELPDLGAVHKQGDVIAVVESVKAAADIFSPVGGTIAAVNEGLEEEPEIVNASPEERGWLCRFSGVSASDLETLMTEDEYEEFIGRES